MAAQPESPSLPAERRLRILEQLLERNGVVLRRQARRHSSSAALAEDALQDACLQFLCHFDAPPEVALAWMIVVVKRCAWKIGAKARRHAADEHLVSRDPQPGSELVLIGARPRLLGVVDVDS